MENITCTDLDIDFNGDIVPISVIVTGVSDNGNIQVTVNTFNATIDEVDKIIKLLKKAKKTAKANH